MLRAASLDEDAEDARDGAWLDASDGSFDEDGEDARDEIRLEASDGALEAVRLDALDGLCNLAQLEARLEALDDALVDGSLDGVESSGPTHSGRASAIFLRAEKVAEGSLNVRRGLEDEREEERLAWATRSSLSVPCDLITGGSAGAIVRKYTPEDLINQS